MPRPKKVVEEPKLKEVPMEELGLEEIEDLPPVLEVPTEPTEEEQSQNRIAELEQKVQDLTMQLYNKEHEIDVLKGHLQEQADYYDKAIARLVLATYGG